MTTERSSWLRITRRNENPNGDSITFLADSPRVAGESDYRDSRSPGMTNSTRTIPVGWMPYLDDFALALRAAGAPDTTLSTRLNHLRRVARTIGAPTPLDVDGDRLTRWAGRQEWSIETRRSYRQSLLAFYRWAQGSGRVTENPALALLMCRQRRPNRAPARITCTTRHSPRPTPAKRRMLRLGAECGCAAQRSPSPTLRDLIEDLEGWSLLVHGKGNKDRVVPLPDALAADLRKLPHGTSFLKRDGHLSRAGSAS